MDVVKTIHSQLFMNKQSTMKVWSWGAHKWAKKDNKTLVFKVNAHRFSGFISIKLNSADLYDVGFFDNKTLSSLIKNPRSSSVLTELNDVYFDTMVDLIDDYIEKIDSYHY